MKRPLWIVLSVAGVIVAAATSAAPAQIRFDLGTAALTLDEQGRISALALKDGSTWPVDERPVFYLETDLGRRAAAVQLTGEHLLVQFQGGSSAEFVVRTQPGPRSCSNSRRCRRLSPRSRPFTCFTWPCRRRPNWRGHSMRARRATGPSP